MTLKERKRLCLRGWHLHCWREDRRAHLPDPFLVGEGAVGFRLVEGPSAPYGQRQAKTSAQGQSELRMCTSTEIDFADEGGPFPAPFLQAASHSTAPKPNHTDLAVAW